MEKRDAGEQRRQPFEKQIKLSSVKEHQVSGVVIESEQIKRLSVVMSSIFTYAQRLSGAL